MVDLDIDKFLDNFNEDVQTVTKKKEIDLDFQREIENKIENLEKRSQDSDLETLRNIYGIVKNFDGDLQNKFLGIENTSSEALIQIGTKYSTNFLNSNKKQVEFLKQKIDSFIVEFEKYLKEEKFSFIVKTFLDMKKSLKYIPDTFLEEKILLENRIRIEETKFYNFIEEFKNKKNKEFKELIKKEMLELKEALRTKNLKEASSIIVNIKNTFDSIPKILISSISKEKIKIIKILDYCENLLLNEYKAMFNNNMILINKLFEKFQNAIIKKNIEESLLIYNELLIEFEKLPEVFIEKKVLIYDKMNQSYSKINKLLINNNIEMIMNSYNSSKKIESVKEYLNHAKQTNIIDINNLENLKQEIKSLPQKYTIEIKEVENEIDSIIKNFNSKILETQNINQKRIEPQLENKNQDLENINIFLEKIKELKKIENKEELTTKIKILKQELETFTIDTELKNKILLKLKNIYIHKNSNSNQKLEIKKNLDVKIEEILNNLKLLKKTNNKEEFKKIVHNTNQKIENINIEKSKQEILKNKLKIIYEHKKEELIAKVGV